MNRLEAIKFGHCSFKDLKYWIVERHKIWHLKNIGEPKPWTKDPIFQRYKFCNVFRQLDKGTVALTKMLESAEYYSSLDLIFFNVIWYRLFNWHEHATALGFVNDYRALEEYIMNRAKTGQQIFTSAHMTHGKFYEDKHVTYLKACKQVWDNIDLYTKSIINAGTMEEAFNELLGLPMIGRFVGYEIVCDLRFTPLLDHATDVLTWANMGPGAQRGLKRLRMPHKNQSEGLKSMRKLWKKIMISTIRHLMTTNWSFELREVEHSLCELDKYQRVKMNEGKPRQKYCGI